MLIIAGGFLLGLLVGSFLNVVIYRLPVMMEREWRQDCRELLAAETAGAATDQVADEIRSADQSDEVFNLLTPRSRCQNCGTTLRWLPLWYSFGP